MATFLEYEVGSQAFPPGTVPLGTSWFSNLESLGVRGWC